MEDLQPVILIGAFYLLFVCSFRLNNKFTLKTMFITSFSYPFDICVMTRGSKCAFLHSKSFLKRASNGLKFGIDLVHRIKRPTVKTSTQSMRILKAR